MQPRRILVVEDEADQRSALAGILRQEGYGVSEASSAEEALGLLRSHRFDLIVTDYQLGGASGTWLAQIAALTDPMPPRALVITAHDTVVGTETLKVLRKPLNIRRFLTEVAQASRYEPAESPALVPPARVGFRLYVSDSRSSRTAVKRLRDLLRGYDESAVSLTIVDLSTTNVHEAEEHRIIATPTLLKTFPAPRVWITGASPDPRVIARILEQAGVEAKA